MKPDIVIYILLNVIALLFFLKHLLNKNTEKQRLVVGNAQTIGKREQQEDSFATTSTENGLLAVLADGMGGYTQGKMASHTAVETFVRRFRNTGNIHPLEKFFRETVLLCNQRVLQQGKGERSGTTLVAVVINENELYWVSVGDSAIVLFRDGELENLNKKHVFQRVLEERYLSGEISEKELIRNPKKKRLTSYIGHEGFKDIEIYNKTIRLSPGDKVILCSDGVYNSLSELEIEHLLAKKTSPTRIAEEIIDLIDRKDLPHQDNATLIIIEYK